MRLRVAVVIVLTIIVCLVLFYIYWEYIRTVGDIDSDLEVKRVEVLREMQRFKLKKLLEHKDLVLRKEDFAQISDRQKYVTPTNQIVQNYILSNHITTVKDAYLVAVGWVWVSDQTLHGELEKWLLPEQFIQDTPTYPSNPVSGSMVSDCESQAYTLVSILEAVL